MSQFPNQHKKLKKKKKKNHKSLGDVIFTLVAKLIIWNLKEPWKTTSTVPTISDGPSNFSHR